jgi:catechol 2,3-dioxygenase-like lactoylglutathione lyase family enzyme
MTHRARLVGINHVALEVGDLEAAVAFYDSLFAIRAVAREPGMAFLDMGDQSWRCRRAARRRRTTRVTSASSSTTRSSSAQRCARRAWRRSAPAASTSATPGANFVQVVDYRDIMFTKAPEVLGGMALDGLAKRDGALAELREHGLAE